MAWTLLLWVGSGACAGPPAPSPSVVISVSPEAVCAGDHFATPIQLSGRDSAPRLTLVPVPPDPDEPPLSFHWSFTGAAVDVVSGDVDRAELTVATTGDRPLGIALRVESGEGGVGMARLVLPITVDCPPAGAP